VLQGDEVAHVEMEAQVPMEGAGGVAGCSSGGRGSCDDVEYDVEEDVGEDNDGEKAEEEGVGQGETSNRSPTC
jgi:hypothetical protein